MIFHFWSTKYLIVIPNVSSSDRLCDFLAGSMHDWSCTTSVGLTGTAHRRASAAGTGQASSVRKQSHARLRNVFQLAPPRRLGGQRPGRERDTPCESLQPFCCQSGPLEKENGCVLVYCDCFLVVLNGSKP